MLWEVILFFFQAEDGIRDIGVTGVQTCALPISRVVAGDLRVWCVCYVGYLLAVLDPVTSLVRYLLLLFPLGTVLAATSRSRAFRICVAASFLADRKSVV